MKWVKLWVPVIVWAGVIFFFSSIPDLRINSEYDFILRKIAHIIEYFILAFLLYKAFSGSFSLNAGRLFIYPAIFSFLYAISDEIHQYFVVGRYCSIKDVLIDSLGIVCFYLVIKFKHRKGAASLAKAK